MTGGYDDSLDLGHDTITPTEYQPTALPAPSRPEGVPVTIGRSSDASWMEQAACRGLPAGWWFPGPRETGDGGTPGRKICWEQCPVRLDCLWWAVDHREKHGVWGGLNYWDRRLVARNNERPAA